MKPLGFIKSIKKDNTAEARLIPNNQITLLKNGEAYFPALEAALERAVEEIYLTAYIFKNDTMGRRITESLKKAAMRGVKTRVLIDGFGSNPLSQTVVDKLIAANVMVMKFRPKISPWTIRRRRLRRLHRKIVVVDRKLAFVGGINIINDCETPDQTTSRYDYAVCVEGPLVKEIHASVRRIWRRVVWIRLSVYRGRDDHGPVPVIESRGRMRAAFLVRDNLRHRRDIENAYLRAIEQAHTEIILANAYFLPGQKFRRALVNAVGRGVRVVLLLQGRMEYPLLQYASKALYGSFLESGIKIYEYHKSFLHAKVAVIDTHWSTVGSSNLDPFSLLLSLEANIVVEDETFAGTLKQSIETAITDGAHQVQPVDWKIQPVHQQIKKWISYGLTRFMTGMAGYAPDTHGDENDRQF